SDDRDVELLIHPVPFCGRAVADPAIRATMPDSSVRREPPTPNRMEADPVTETSPAQNDALLDNGVVRVKRWTLAPGTSIGRHRHEYPYVVVPISGGRLTFRDGQGDNS